MNVSSDLLEMINHVGFPFGRQRKEILTRFQKFRQLDNIE